MSVDRRNSVVPRIVFLHAAALATLIHGCTEDPFRRPGCPSNGEVCDGRCPSDRCSPWRATSCDVIYRCDAAAGLREPITIDDPLVLYCSRGDGICEEPIAEDFPDYATTIALIRHYYWCAVVKDYLPLATIGLCDNGKVRFISWSSGLSGEERYYDADSGRFIGWSEWTDVCFPPDCGYWPHRFAFTDCVWQDTICGRPAPPAYPE